MAAAEFLTGRTLGADEDAVAMAAPGLLLIDAIRADCAIAAGFLFEGSEYATDSEKSHDLKRTP